MANEASTASNIATIPQRNVPAQAHYADVFSDPVAFDHAQRVAKVFASSKLVPPHMQGNIADCLIALQIARRLNEEPLTVMQNIYIVSGRPGWYTSYMISRANRAGVFTGRITWETTGSGETLSVTAKAVLADSGEPVTATCDYHMAKADGWTNNAKYRSMPEHMLRWRSAAMLIRLYAPEVMLGMPAVEELETMKPMKDVTPPTQAMKDTLDSFAAGQKTNGNGNAAAAAAEDQPASPSAKREITADAEKGPAPEQVTHPVAGSATPAPLTDEKSYAAHANAWREFLTDADAGEARWKEEKRLRNAANVTPEVRDELEAKLKAKVAQLRASAANTGKG